MSNNVMDVSKCESGYIEGIVDAKKESLVFTTIPYDKNWIILVDGKRVKAEDISNAFLSFEVRKGKHCVEMRYSSDYVVVSVIGTIIFALIAVFVLSYDVVYKKKVHLGGYKDERQENGEE